MTSLEIIKALDLALFFFLSRSRKFYGGFFLLGIRLERIDTDQGQAAIMLERLILHGFFLNLATLVACFHRSEYTAAIRNTFKKPKKFKMRLALARASRCVLLVGF